MFETRSPRVGSEGPCAPALELFLLGGFELRDHGLPVPFSSSAQRLVAFLAMHDRPVSRTYTAGVLWLDASEDRATASLRSLLWQVRRLSRDLVVPTSTHLSLTPDAVVDVRTLVATAHRLADPADPIDAERPALPSGELLPGWYDDWVIVERERIRQLELHSMENLCERLFGWGRFAAAIEVGLAAIAAEPFRESAHRMLIRAHLAEGNRSEALRQFEIYRQLMWGELGLRPSPDITDLVRDVAAGVTP
jgi:DNA-binding SARP family transcriptional activator